MNCQVYDVIVIGAGMGGVAAATTAAESGARVALVERGAIGSDRRRPDRHGVRADVRALRQSRNRALPRRSRAAARGS
ncbi:FAD-dependent oxidoreductase [bacterium]|nr:MAG: FAD-dependent oxidoreductase [bacterium]